MATPALAYVGGSFDGLHRGHVNLLRYAATLGRVVVAVNGDAFHEAYKGAKPMFGEADRLAAILACRYVTNAFIMPSHDRQRAIIAAWKPAYIVHGSDWMGKRLLTQLGIDEAFLREHDIQMAYTPYTEGISSSAVRERLRA